MSMRILFFSCLLFGLFAQAQKKNVSKDEPNTKFGKIVPEDLMPKAYSIDSSAPAVVLFEVGNTEIVGNQKGWISMKFNRRKRIHILNKNGYEYADVTVPLYRDGNDEEQLNNLKATTYNLENGKIVETKLEKSSIFKEQVDKNRTRIKFTFPAVKEGSIIEFEYTITSDFYFSLVPWDFQGQIPRLWSEYSFSLPQFMDYLFFSQGYNAFHIKEQKDRRGTFTFIESSNAGPTQTTSFSCNVTDYRWVMKDVPVLKPEKFTSTLDNHMAKIEFQLAGYRDPMVPKQIMTDWGKAAKDLLEHENFGKQFLAHNGWLDDELKLAVGNGTTQQAKARNIFAYVRDHYSCNDHSALLTTQSLKTTVKIKKGSVSDINLLLVALFRQAGINADPVVLSTRDNGYISSFYPMMNKLNYVLCKTGEGESTTYLDASYNYLGYGKLMFDCYNGEARIISENVPQVSFIADSLKEEKFTMASLSNIDGKWTGHVMQVPGYYQSYQVRSQLQTDGMDGLKKELQKTYAPFGNISQLKVDSLKMLEQPVKIEYDLEPQSNGEDIIYINPMLGETIGDNPFKSADRKYPVEMPFTRNETFVGTYEIPEGYVLDEAPKSMRMLLNQEGDGKFEYLLSVSGNFISMRVVLQLKRAFFDPEEYEMLREFYNRVVSKQSENLVFKKKK